MTAEAKTVTCSRCGGVEEIPVPMLDGEPISWLLDFKFECDNCAEMERAEAQKKTASDRGKMLWAEFLESFGAQYGQATPDRVKPSLQAALRWSPSVKAGLMLTGPVRVGKSSVVALIVKRLIWNDGRPKACGCINGPGLKRLVEAWHSDDREEGYEARILHKTLKTRLLCVIDDIDKCKFSPSAVERLWEILEHRTSHNLTTILTCNASGEQLARKMMVGDITRDYAESIVGRLGDFCAIISA